MGWFKSALRVTGDGLSHVGDGIKHAAESTGDAFSEAAKATANGVKEAANATAGGVVDAANATAGGVIEAANWTEHAAVDAANVTAKGFNDAAGWADGAAQSAWKATSEEANAVGHAVENAGIVIGTGFIAGAEAAAEGLEDGVEVVGEGLVAIGEYISSHLCDLAFGAAIAAVMAGLAADGEEEEATGLVAVACAAGDAVAMDLASTALAKVMVEPIYAIPGVSDALGHKDEVESVISFVISQACEEHEAEVIASAGQFLAGVIIYAMTSAVCEGEVPGGYKLWKGVQGTVEDEIKHDNEVAKRRAEQRRQGLVNSY
jgi:hypothetical protein